jgi:hypothetical protein
VGARPWPALSCLALLSIAAQACAFPIIEFEPHVPRSQRLRAGRERSASAAATTLQDARADSARGRAVKSRSHTSPADDRLYAEARPPRRKYGADSLDRDTRSSERQDARPLPPPPAASPTRARPSVAAPIIPEPESPPPARASVCLHALARAGVRFSTLRSSEAPGVAWPIRLDGPLRGVAFEPVDHSPVHATLDCRLALALVAWASDLRSAGVRRVEHYSMYRPGALVAGTRIISGHAHGLAIDAARFTTQTGAVLDVVDDWEGRARGQSPCPMRRDESGASRLLRSVTCSAVDRRLFQVVLTPHYNHDHDNHVHLEVKPDVDSVYVR